MLRMIEISKIRESEVKFERGSLDNLIASIEKIGLINPISVVVREDYYVIMDGIRRFRACLALKYEEVPCIVMILTDEQILISQIITSTAYVPTSKAQLLAGLKKIMAMYPKMTMPELCEKICKDPKWVIGMLGLKKLVSKAIKLVEKGEIPLFCGYVLTKLNPSMQGYAIKDPCIHDPVKFVPKATLHLKQKHYLWS